MAIDLGTQHALERISGYVRRGACTLFLGSAVHAGKKGSPGAYPREQRPAMAPELMDAFLDHCQGAAYFDRRVDNTLARLALFYELGSSRAELIDEIARRVQIGKQPSPMLLDLARLDFPIVITTNYDDLFEQALKRADKRPQVVVYKKHGAPDIRIQDATAQRPIVFKLHGCIKRPQSIVITEDDYIDFVGHMTEKEKHHPVPLSLRSHLMRCPTLFLGYRLSDYNLRLVFRTLRWKTDESRYPAMYSVDWRPDPLIRSVWQERRGYVRFLAEDIWSFVPALCGEVQMELAP